ncbi:MAG: peptidase U32 family protein, partial [Candidatus Omnitrophota bacterium]
MSPIRDWASLEACKNYANAVYFGVDELSMRAASGIKVSELSAFTQKCHSYGLKGYLTVNTVVYNQDIKKAEKLLKKAKKEGVDAVIVWDPAVIQIARKIKLPFIVSTQANISNYESAIFYKKLGAKRVVLAREMTLKQIKELTKKVKIEVEVFVHGAMCMAISGRCILSAYLYGKSANCGSCAQPCRKEWMLSDEEGNAISNEGKYFMSAKDLCMIEFVPEL